MRLVLIPLLLVLSACGQGEEETKAANGVAEVSAPSSRELQTFAGAGRDRLCIGGTSAPAAVITYAAHGASNCSARGTMQEQAGKLLFVPQEDTSCRIEVRREDESRLALGAVTAGCAYYCGPGASFDGKTFARMDKAEPVTDLAGDPLC